MTILEAKLAEIEKRSRIRPLETLRSRAESLRAETRGFVDAIERAPRAIIAELKDPSLARAFADSGVTALSIVTDTDFLGGSNANLSAARDACSLPLMRRDYIIDPYQIYEARTMGADCIALNVSLLDDVQMVDLSNLTQDLGMDVLVEVTSMDELERAVQTDATLIGVNSSDETLLEQVPSDRIAVVYNRTSSRAMLLGDVLMRERNPVDALKRFMGE